MLIIKSGQIVKILAVFIWSMFLLDVAFAETKAIYRPDGSVFMVVSLIDGKKEGVAKFYLSEWKIKRD
ncbi:MAG: hypothetical protein Q8O02_00770 [Candidatus Omnitrophota bacterium]|nr:hypothetical protein [Candidatus Omnitrophota bacterium]